MYLSVYEAIEHRYLLQFHYCGYSRIIEPHVFGHDRRFGDVLRGYQIGGADESGTHRGWKWFRTGKIESLQVLTSHFPGARAGADRTVERLERVYSRIDGMVAPGGLPAGLPVDSVVDC
jgi:hypothetical protein